MYTIFKNIQLFICIVKNASSSRLSTSSYISSYSKIFLSCLEYDDFTNGKKLIHWTDPSSQSSPKIPDDDIPFIIIKKGIKECQHGPDRDAKRKKQQTKKSKENEQVYYIIFLSFLKRK